MKLGDALNELVLGTGNDTPNTRVILTRGLNAGLGMATVKYHPPEYKGPTRLVAESSKGFTSLAGTDWLELDYVWNETADCIVWPMTYHQLMMHVPLYTGDDVRFYAVYGDVLYYQPYPKVNQNLVVSIFAMPDRLSSLEDVIPLDKHLEFIFTVAMQYYWATKEEKESQDIWSTLGNMFSIPYDQMSAIQRALKEEPPYDPKVRPILQQGSA